MTLNIKVLGTAASLTENWSPHFSLLLTVESRGKKTNILIDPAVKTKEPVDLIILTQPEEDHYKALKYYLKKYPDIKILTTQAILEKLPIDLITHNFIEVDKSVTINGVKFLFFKTTHKVGVPSIGLAIRTPSSRISIIPEFLKLGKYEENLIKNSIWICGVGDYDEDDEDSGKLSFKSLLELAEKLKPKAIYLTNIRKSIWNMRDKINNELAKWNGAILLPDDELKFKKKYHRGLYLVKPHAKLIYDGEKRIVLKQRQYKMSWEEMVLLDNEYAYGYITLAEPFPIKNVEEFENSQNLHKVTLQEFHDWGWNFPIYGYPVFKFEPFKKPKPVDLPRGIQTFVKEVERYYVTKISSFKDYNPEEMTNEQLADDIRLLVAYVATKIERGEW